MKTKLAFTFLIRQCPTSTPHLRCIVSNGREQAPDIRIAFNQALSCVRDIVIMAELLQNNSSLGQGVARKSRPDVVLNLIPKPAREPIVEECGSNIPRRADLQRDKVCPLQLLMRKYLHRVVADSEDDANK